MIPKLLSLSLICTLPTALADSATPATPAPDFGDFSSSTLTGKAWDAFNAKQLPLAEAYARKCVELYAKQAAEMQLALRAPATEKEEVFKN